MTSDPLWSVLIATLSRRQVMLLRLLGVLLPQAEAAGCMEVIGCSNDGQRPLGEYRQALLEAARGKYVSFIDDDDLVSLDFAALIIPCLDGATGYQEFIWRPGWQPPDVVGFRARYTVNGVSPQTVFCSLASTGKADGPDGLYRDLTHIQPLRADLARLGDFRAGWPEDNAWYKAVRPRVRTEEYIDRVLYSYEHRTWDTVQGRTPPDPPLPRPRVDSPCFRWLEVP